MKSHPVYFTDAKTNELKVSGFFKKYTAKTFTELEMFASIFNFKIVDRYYTFCEEEGHHIPAIEVC